MDFIGFNESKQSTGGPHPSDTASLDGAADPLDLGDDEHEPAIPSMQERRGLLHDSSAAADGAFPRGGADGASGRTHSSATAYWTRIIFWSSVVTIVIGLSVTGIAFYVSSRAILVLSVSCVVLALCALTAATLSAFAIVAVKDLDTNPATSFAALQFYLNTGCMLCLSLITLGVTVMSLQPDFIEYIRLHWNDGDDEVAQLWRHFDGLTLSQAQDQITGSVHAIGASSVLMALLMTVSVACASNVRPAHAPIFGVQSFLWVHAMIGLLGCILISVSIYSLYHEWSLPISQVEGRWLRALGVLCFGMALLGLLRVYWSEDDSSSANSWHYLHAGSNHSHSGGSSGHKNSSARKRRHSQHRDGTAAGVISIGASGGGDDKPTPPPPPSGAVAPNASSDPISELNSGDEPPGHPPSPSHHPSSAAASRRNSGNSPPAPSSGCFARVWYWCREWGVVTIHVAPLCAVALVLFALWIVWVYRSVPEHATTFVSHRQWLSDDAHMELQHNPTKLALILHIKLALLSVVAILAAAYVSAGAVLAGCLTRLIRAERAMSDRQ